MFQKAGASSKLTSKILRFFLLSLTIAAVIFIVAAWVKLSSQQSCMTYSSPDNASSAITAAVDATSQPFLTYKKRNITEFIDLLVNALNQPSDMLGVRPFNYLFDQNRPDILSPTGCLLEFGVFRGLTIRSLANKYPKKLVWGFDGFLGLPHKWNNIGTNVFKLEDSEIEPYQVPENLKHGIYDGVEFTDDDEPMREIIARLVTIGGWKLPNVRLVKGWFNDTVGTWERAILRPPRAYYDSAPRIAFLHADADVYSSTDIIFSVLGDYLEPQTIVLFDELINYPGYEYHEIKAFYELVARRRLAFEIIGAKNGATRHVFTKERHAHECSVAIRIIKSP